jgi:hypothetical protein
MNFHCTIRTKDYDYLGTDEDLQNALENAIESLAIHYKINHVEASEWVREALGHSASTKFQDKRGLLLVKCFKN